MYAEVTFKDKFGGLWDDFTDFSLEKLNRQIELGLRKDVVEVVSYKIIG